MSECAAVPEGGGRIGRGAEERPTTSRGEDDATGEEGLDAVCLLVVHEDAAAASPTDDQLQRLVVLKEGDRLLRPHLADHEVRDPMPGVVSPGMEDPMVVMPALQSESGLTIGGLVKGHPHTDHLAYPCRCLLREDADGIGVVEVDTGNDGVVIVLIGGIARCTDSGYAALSVVRIAVLDRSLSDQGYGAASGEMVGRV